MNRYFLDPFGCVKNQVDAENMMAHLNNAGWKSVPDAKNADLIIVNSCGFIESAKQESINAVLEWRENYPGKKILLTGCLSQRYAKELPDILKEADGFIGIEDPAEIVKAANKTLNNSSDSISNSQSSVESDLFSNLFGERPLLSLPGSAYVKISEGCDNCCSYCAIPLIRGSLVSRKISDIVEECRTLLKRGIIELNIIGQDIGAYGTDFSDNESENSRLPELLNAISELEGNFWVRLLYIHPDHFPLQILDLFARDKRFLPYFDIPFQHASAKILTAMNRSKRNYHLHAANLKLDLPSCEIPAKRYLTLLEIIRGSLPDAVIRSTFMLGFPGESEEDFSELLDFQQRASLDWLGCFIYSREEGTSSYSMKGRVPSKISVMRKSLIEEKQLKITEKNMEKFIDHFFDVLIEEEFSAEETNNEETNSNEEKIWLGRLYCQAPEVDGTTVVITTSDQKLKVGTFVRCKIISRLGFDLEAKPAN